MANSEVIVPSPEFYSIYTNKQIDRMVESLEVDREIPREFNYMGDGAANWERWQQILQKEEGLNILKGTVELIATNLDAIDRRTDSCSNVNVVDLGAGNAQPVRGLLERLVERSVMGKYVATDVSQSMLDLAKRNIKTWFGDDVPFEGAIRDMSHERFGDLLEHDDRTVNLVMLLGGTATNMHSFSNTVQTVRDSLGNSDLFIYADKPDTTAARGYLSFGTGQDISPSHRYILDLMNIDRSQYEPDPGYDEATRMRYVRIRLNQDVSIQFETDDQGRRVDLKEGETIQLLRIWHLTAWEVLSEFERQGLDLLHYDTTKDQEYLLSISSIRP